jgi:hypothetical protein
MGIAAKAGCEKTGGCDPYHGDIADAPIDSARCKPDEATTMQIDHMKSELRTLADHELEVIVGGGPHQGLTGQENYTSPQTPIYNPTYAKLVWWEIIQHLGQ